MDGVFFAVLGIVMLGIIVVLLYLLDKVNTLESRANDGGFGSSLFGSAAPAVDNGFDGLSGQSLWDAVGGMSASGALSLDELNSLRQRYQPVLHKHILGVIEDAAKDADNGVARPPPTTRTVTTLRAEVQSWLPSQYLKNITWPSSKPHKTPTKSHRPRPLWIKPARRFMSALKSTLRGPTLSWSSATCLMKASRMTIMAPKPPKPPSQRRIRLSLPTG